MKKSINTNNTTTTQTEQPTVRTSIKEARLQADIFAKNYRIHHAAIAQVEAEKATEIDAENKAKEYLKSFAQQRGNRLFGKDKTVRITDEVTLQRRLGSATYDLSKLHLDEIEQLICDYPELFQVKLDIKSITAILEKDPNNIMATEALALLHGCQSAEQTYTYLVTLAPNSSASKK